MRFINKGSDVQVRIKEKSLFGGEGCRWDCVRHGEVVELDEGIGLAYGFEMVTEGKINETKVETKQFEDFSKIRVPEFEEELSSIKGIGDKTAWDITKVFPTKEKLIEAIGLGAELPFRDDVADKLRSRYGE